MKEMIVSVKLIKLLSSVIATITNTTQLADTANDTGIATGNKKDPLAAKIA